MISFKTTKTDRAMISRIARRAKRELWPNIDLQEVEMDLTAVHVNDVALDLSRLFHADGFNFVHDVGGIRRNLNRKTGKLENQFSPRFAK